MNDLGTGTRFEASSSASIRWLHISMILGAALGSRHGPAQYSMVTYINSFGSSTRFVACSGGIIRWSHLSMG